MSWTACRPDLLATEVASAAAATCLARSEICVPDWLTSSIVVVISWTVAACSLVPAACSCVEARISRAAELTFSVTDRILPVRSLRLSCISLKTIGELADLVGRRVRQPLGAEVAAADPFRLGRPRR